VLFAAVVLTLQVNAGPLPPHILDAPCAEAHLANPGRLVACGFLYADNDTVSTSTNNTLQVSAAAVGSEVVAFTFKRRA
jgi:hypothetical protein